MFKIERQDCTLNSVILNREKNVERVAMYLNFEMKSSTAILSEFDEEYKNTFFIPMKEDDEDLADSGEAEPKEYAYSLRFPKLSNKESIDVGVLDEYKVAIEQFSSSEKINNDIILIQCIIDNVELTFEDQGVVRVKFRVRTYPESADIGYVGRLLKQKLSVTLEPPKVCQDSMDLTPEKVDSALAGLSVVKK